MKKIWPYIATFFIGLSAGIMIGVKYLGEKTVFKGQIRIKQRGEGNILKPEITANLAHKTKRQAKKEAKDQAKIIKRNERKKRKDLKRLEKLP